MKKGWKVLIVIVAILAAAALMKNLIIQNVLAAAISKVAHVPARVGSTKVSFSAASASVKDFRLMNPSGFKDRVMLDIPLISIDFNPADLWKGLIHFEELRLDLKEVVVVRNKDGRMNIDAVKPKESEKRDAVKKDEAKKQGKGKPAKLQIDKLYLSVGRVVYKDYTQGDKPKVEEFNVNIRDRVYTNIQEPRGLVSLILVETLTKTTLSRLGTIDLGSLESEATRALTGSLGLAGDGAKTLEDTAKGIIGLFK